MATKKDEAYKDRLNSLTGSLKNKPVVTPIQEVRPVQDPPTAAAPIEKKKDPHENELHVNFWGDRALIEQVKIHGVMTKKTIRQICEEALAAYLVKHGDS